MVHLQAPTRAKNWKRIKLYISCGWRGAGIGKEVQEFPFIELTLNESEDSLPN